MAIATPEQVHRYPRWLRYTIEIVCAILALIAIYNLGQTLLQYLWDHQGRALPEALRKPFLLNLISDLDETGQRPTFREPTQLVSSFIWFAILMAFVLYIRNLFPTVRTSSRGMLVEWGNGWMPVTWESVTGVQVTEDISGSRFVVLTQTNSKGLAGWHRFYSFLYRFGFKRGVLITSAISEFMPLVQTILREIEQEARHTGKAPVTLDEKTRSPLFQLLLSPAGFFSPASKADKDYVSQATAEARVAQPGRVTRLMATYPTRYTTPLTILTAVIALFGLWRALDIFARWVSTQFPGARRVFLFDRIAYPEGTALWWVPLAAILLVALLIPILIVIRNALPNVETRPEGLAVRFFNRWLLVPWHQITAVKTVELDNNQQLVLIQSTDKALTMWHNMYSLVFEGSTQRGILLWSALEPFETLMQQIVLEVSRGQRSTDREDGLLKEDAPAWPIRLIFKAGETLDKLVIHYDKDEESTKFSYARVISAATPMLWIAGVYTAILVASLLINDVLPPSPQRIVIAALFFVFCVVEWLLTAILAKSFEQTTGPDAHVNRPFYLYPLVQLPRILPLLLGLIFVLFGLPFLTVLAWVGAAFWSFLLAAGLWDSMYGWDSTKFVIMGAVPALYQLVMMLIWLVIVN